MEESKSILHELYVFSEWKPEAEYLQKPDNILPENISSIWRFLNFFGPKKSLFDSVSTHKEHQQKWHIALGDEGKVIAVLTDNILEIRTKRSEYATIAARTTVNRDAYPQWRKLVWSPDCAFIAVAYGTGVVSFFDLTASNLFSIPTDCSRTGGLECTDNTHAVADIIFMPLRVKDNKWNWEVLIVTYEGKLRGYLVSQTEGFTLHHTFNFPGGVGAVTYCTPHSTLYVAGMPRVKDPSSPLGAGITAWRILNDDPFYKLSVVSDRLEMQQANERFQFYIPFVSMKHLAYIVQMVQSPDNSKLACLHCNGDVTIWSLPLIKLLHRFTINQQPECDKQSPLARSDVNDKRLCLAHELRWWTDEEIIVSRFSGSVTVCGLSDMVNILGKKPEFFQGVPRITCAHNGTFMVLECESNVLPVKKNRSDDSMDLVEIPTEPDGSVLEMSKELIKSVLYAITDIETFQPKPKKITVVSRIYRLLGVRSTTPDELFSRKIESGNYKEALNLAETFRLDSDLVFQQQWRKNPVSTDAIRSYLSKVSKKIWVVHQCVDRLPETMPAAKELLQFGLDLTTDEILAEINKERIEDEHKKPEDIVLEDLNAYSSELLRCRHVMLFYRERLGLYEEILRCEKSTYLKDEYDRLRSNSIIHSASEIAKEGRIEALTCLWQHIKTLPMQFAVLDKLPETMNPMEYKHLLPTKEPMEWFDDKSPIKVKPHVFEKDWCRKPIFKSIWSSNWSEDISPDMETNSIAADSDLAKWYSQRAREMEERSGLVSHALTLVAMATRGGVVGLDKILFHLTTLDTLIYDVNVEGVTLRELENMSTHETAIKLMQMSTPRTFLSDLKNFVIPYLKRYEMLTGASDACLGGLADYLECVSVDDLSHILLVLQSPREFELDVRTHLELAERCLFAHSGTAQLAMACDLLDTILKETDGSISPSELIRRAKRLESIVWGSSKLSWRGVKVPPRELRDTSVEQANRYLAAMARGACKQEEKLSPQDWEKLRQDIMDLQSSLFTSVSREKCNEIYASALLTSGDVPSIRLASEVLSSAAEWRASPGAVSYPRSVDLVLAASREYFNSASSLTDPALQRAKCCLALIKDDNKEIRREEDLISALQILAEFNMTLLPIEVRLREDKMSLIEECMKMDAKAYQAGHKFLKLAQLLRAGGDEQAREGLILQLVCTYALSSGPSGLSAAVASASRLSALHYPSSALLTHVATQAKVHSDVDSRRLMLAAAALSCPSADIEGILTTRLGLELECLEQMVALADSQYQSTEEEFSDAITTPVVERKDLVAPDNDKNVPKLNRLIENLQHKYKLRNKTSSERTPHCQEFYHNLYPEHAVSDSYYRYDRFSLPDLIDETNLGYALLKMFYTRNCIDVCDSVQLETDVVQTCAQELLYKDTALAVACLLRSAQEYGPTKAWVDANNVDTAINAALYATLVRCNSAEMKDNVYLTKPAQMARATLEKKTASEEQMDLIRQCIDKLTGMGEVDRIRRLGFTVNALMFNADEDYRRETIYMLARSPCQEHLELACSLAAKYGMDMTETCLQAGADAASLQRLATLVPAILPHQAQVYSRIHKEIYPQISGTDHNALLNYFALLRSVDEKELIFGLTAADHIKLLKKAKAASPNLNYKMLTDQQPERLCMHVCSIMKPENVGMVVKLIRTLPAALRLDVAIKDIYAMWLSTYFFSAQAGSSNSKRWLQQYRECASYFNKLGQESLLMFIEEACFSQRALKRIPPGTRVRMIMQAVDYCQQEQENEVKVNKDEIEMSHGHLKRVLEGIGLLALQTGLRAAAAASLLQCLHADADLQGLMDFILQNLVKKSEHVDALLSLISQYAREGCSFPEDFLSRAAGALGRPRRASLSGDSQTAATDMKELANITADMLKAVWPDVEVDVESLETDEGRRKAFDKYIQLTDTWERKKSFIDVLHCWPPTRTSTSRSIHSLYLNTLLTTEGDQVENLALIKLLMSRPVVDDQEVKWLCENAKGHAVINAMWVVLLSKCDDAVGEIQRLVQKHKDSVITPGIDDDLIPTLLDRGMFTKLVSTTLFSSLGAYILSNGTEFGDPDSKYTPSWAFQELRSANMLAEAGHLLLMAEDIPVSVQGYSEAVLYAKKEKNKEKKIEKKDRRK